MPVTPLGFTTLQSFLLASSWDSLSEAASLLAITPAESGRWLQGLTPGAKRVWYLSVSGRRHLPALMGFTLFKAFPSLALPLHRGPAPELLARQLMSFRATLFSVCRASESA
jgi:hypothetical protein